MDRVRASQAKDKAIRQSQASTTPQPTPAATATPVIVTESQPIAVANTEADAVNINEHRASNNAADENVRIVSSVKSAGGFLKLVKHWSACNQCEMTFMLWIPENEVREEPYPAIYFLSGLTCNWENTASKGHYGRPCAKH